MSDGRKRILLAQFPGNNVTHPDVMDYTTDLFIKLINDPLVGPGNVLRWRETTTPITKARNKCLADAEAVGADFVIMVDSDMNCDYLVGQDGKPKRDQLGNVVAPSARPFWDSTWQYVKDNPHQWCVIAAPYCGPPPVENVYTFTWVQCETGNANADFQIQGIPRSEAAMLTGIREAAALPTGLILIDMRVVREMRHPRFYYEYPDDRQTTLASTEDVTFSRDIWYTARLKGLPVFVGCNWDAWAGHWKLKLVGKPAPIPAGAVPNWLHARGTEIADQRAAAWAGPINRLAPPPKPQVVIGRPNETPFCPLPAGHLPPLTGAILTGYAGPVPPADGMALPTTAAAPPAEVIAPPVSEPPPVKPAPATATTKKRPAKRAKAAGR
jgi:hypothetical protein